MSVVTLNTMPRVGVPSRRRPAVPLPVERIHVELTNRCNFSCEFCPDSIMTRPRGSMDFDLVVQIIEEVARENIAQQVHFHVMGEPTLYPRLVDAVSEGARRGVQTCVTTNGSLLDAEMVQALEAAGLSLLVISVQTPDPESFAMRGAPKLTYEQYEGQIVEAVRPLMEQGGAMRVTLNFLTTPFQRLAAPWATRVEIAGRRHRLRRQLGTWARNLMGPSDPRLQEVMARIQRARPSRQGHIDLTDRVCFETRIAGDWAAHFRDPERLVGARFGACNGLMDNFGIHWNGDFVLCCVDYDGKTTTHTICQSSIMDYLSSPEIHSIAEGFRRFRVVHPYCQQCLGDRGLARSMIRQGGSILYFRILRRFVDQRRL